MDSLLSYALAYARRGWPIFPCNPADKRPITGSGFKDASCNEAQIRRWWLDNPDAMIGLPTGSPIGAFVVDLDPKGEDTADDLAARLIEALGIVIEDWTDVAVNTPRGGRHLYFAMPEGEDIGNRAGMIPQVDVRGTGGYVIAAPSVRPDGRAYTLDGVGYSDLFEPPQAPPELIDMILRRGAWDQTPKPQEGATAVFRNEALASEDARAQAIRRYVLSAVDGVIADLRATGEGGRNHALNIAALRLGHYVGAGALDEGFALAALEGVARGWPNIKKSLGTIKSGMTAGKKEPADLSGVGVRAGQGGRGASLRPPPPDDDDRPEAPKGAARGGSQGAKVEGSPLATAGGLGGDNGGNPPDQDSDDAGEPVDLEVLARCANEPQNDLGNARRMLAWYGRDMLVVREVGPHSWTGTHWERDGGEEAFARRAQDTSERIALEARLIKPTFRELAAIELRDEILKKPVEERTADDRAIINRGDEAETAVNKRKGDRRKFSISSGNNSRLSAMVTQATPHITVAPEDMDADPLAINLRNGTLRLAMVDDLEAPIDVERKVWGVRLDAHDPADRISKIMPVEYDEYALCPKWDEFMERFQPNKHIRRFLQAWHGYSLTGMTGEQAFVFNYGLGANGKSTFMEALARLQGNYAQTLPAEALTGDMQRRGDQATPELARLTGARLVRCAELPRGQPFRESTLKMLTGGEKILVRNLHEGFFEMSPVFKAIGSGNDRPPIGGVDEGIWRRMKLVPWSVTIPANERRPMEQVLGEFEAEGPGILNWLIDGLIDYMRHGLVVPDEIQAATEEYRDDMDPVGSFCRSCVVRLEGATVTARDMYLAYVAWCNANSVKPFTEKTFPSIMKQKGYEKKDARIRVYMDVKLQDVPDDPEVNARSGDFYGDRP